MIEKGNQHSRVSKAAFVKNTKRAHIHTAIWKSTLNSEPPTLDPVEIG